MAEIAKIWLRPMARAPMKSVTQALAVPGTGLDGDHAGGGRRQVTLIDTAAWRDACRELGAEVDPRARRANFLVDTLPLGDAIGRRLVIGSVVLEILGETRPCELLDDIALGLCAALRSERRGGVFGRVLHGGLVRVGAQVLLD